MTALLFVAALPTSASGREAISLDVFYDNLDPYGTWVETDDYGYVWHPRDVDESWRPYSDGRWVYTDAGWTWNSDEPYGWAVYHYGRWANLDQVGWVWVPGTQWGPAWVSWRHNPKYVGWAPLPPEAEFREDTGFSEWVDDYYDIGPAAYRFVEIRNLGAPRLRTVFVDQGENINIIQHTTNITHITYQDNVVFNGGIGYDQVSRFSAEPIRRLRLERRDQFDGDPRHSSEDHFRARIEGGALSVMALPFMHSSAPPRKLGDHIGHAEINHGWRNAGPAAEVASIRAKFKSEAKIPASLPPQPKFDRKTGSLENAGARRPGNRDDAADNDHNGRMRENDNGRKPGAPPVASDRRPDGKDTANRPDRARDPGAPPEASPEARDGKGKMKKDPAARGTDEPTTPGRRPGDAPPGPAESEGKGKMKKDPAARGTDEPTTPGRRPGDAPPGPAEGDDKGKMKKDPAARGTDEPTTPGRRPGDAPPIPTEQKSDGKAKGPGPRGTDTTPPDTRRAEGVPPEGPGREGKGPMSQAPRSRNSDEPAAGNNARRPGGAPPEVGERQGKGNGQEAPRPGTPDAAESSSMRKPGPGPKPSEPPARESRKAESEPPKSRQPEAPKHSETDSVKPRPQGQQQKESRSQEAEPQAKGSQKFEAQGERPGTKRPEGAANNNSQQDRGRGNPGGKDKKKPDENAR